MSPSLSYEGVLELRGQALEADDEEGVQEFTDTPNMSNIDSLKPREYFRLGCSVQREGTTSNLK